jgi:hypothetical protein
MFMNSKSKIIKEHFIVAKNSKYNQEEIIDKTIEYILLYFKYVID